MDIRPEGMTEVPSSEVTYPQQTSRPNAVLSPGPGLAGMRDVWDLMEPSSSRNTDEPLPAKPGQNGPCREPGMARALVGTAPVWTRPIFLKPQDVSKCMEGPAGRVTSPATGDSLTSQPRKVPPRPTNLFWDSYPSKVLSLPFT